MLVASLIYAHIFLTIDGPSTIFGGDIGNVAYLVGACIVITNVLCTSLIAGRIWYMQKKIWKGITAKNINKSRQRTYRLIALTIVESGTLYSALWVS
jgi:hypothetical protein